MYVIEVIPLSRGTNVESLTYYASEHFDSGSIIVVPVRKKNIRALVLESQPVSAAKTAVRAATFSLRKLPPQESVQHLPAALIETAKGLAKYYPAQLGAILFALLPPEVREGKETPQYTSPVSHADIRPEVAVLQAQFEERFTDYRATIREVFAHRGSVLFVVPSSADITRATELLSQGIEERLVVFSPALSDKRLQAAYESFYDLTNAKLIITTPTHAYLDRHDITHIIVEQARSRHYKGKTRPSLDHREVLKTLARVTNRTMTMGDILPRSEDEHLRREEFYATVSEQPKRLNFPGKMEVIVQTEEPTAERPFELFSPKMRTALDDALKNREHVFIYAARRGIAPVIVCGDCGHIFRDPDSGTPYSLFRTKANGEELRWFLSPVSGKRIKAADTCADCGSWRLRERGIGIQHMQSELLELFPGAPVHVFDHTTATTHKKAQSIIGHFYDAKGAILLGTQMVLPFLEKPVDRSCITSHDAARSIPSWKAEEEFFALLLTLRERTRHTFYLQTRTEPDELITYAQQGLVEQFYTDELELRNALSYPPFATFILLTWQDRKERVDEIEASLSSELAAYKPRFYSAPQSVAKKTRRHGLIRVPKAQWPIPELIGKLRALPPNIKIEIDPDRIV